MCYHLTQSISYTQRALHKNHAKSEDGLSPSSHTFTRRGASPSSVYLQGSTLERKCLVLQLPIMCEEHSRCIENDEDKDVLRFSTSFRKSNISLKYISFFLKRLSGFMFVALDGQNNIESRNEFQCQRCCPQIGVVLCTLVCTPPSVSAVVSWLKQRNRQQLGRLMRNPVMQVLQDTAF